MVVVDLRELDIEASAKMVHEKLGEFAKKIGMDPEVELSLLSPEEADDHGMTLGPYWTVFWDAGPFEWASYMEGGMSICSSEPMGNEENIPKFIFGESYYLEACQTFGISFISR